VVYEQIGLGGMATVHRAEAQGIAGFSKQIALKRMLPSVAADASLVKSFIREARLASHLRHANVAQTYDLGKVGETYFIAMELVPGRNLREVLKHCAGVVGHMPLPIVMNIVNQICDALDYAHDLCDDSGQPLGIIHRDVSPSNIICSEGGVVKLIDFGIAKASARGMNTQSGTIKGKFGYMAPEYLMGSIDARADLFALGVIAHELLSNRPLFQGKDDMDTLYRVKDMPILPPSRFNPKVPPELDSIIMTALARNPEQRWQRANALHTAVATESKRLGLLAQNSQVVEWIEWAFQQRKGQIVEDDPVISISGGTTELPRAAPKREVPDDFLSASDSLRTLVKPPTVEAIQASRSTDWSAGADLTTPATGSLDQRLGDATKLLRPSGTHRVPNAADLLDTRRDHDVVPASDAPSSRNVIQRNTPLPYPRHTPVEQRATVLEPRASSDDDDDQLRTLPPRTHRPELAHRPSQPPATHHASAFVIAQDQMVPLAPAPAAEQSRPSSPRLPQEGSLLRTLPGQGAMATPSPPKLPPSSPVMSGARTNVQMPRARPSEPRIDDLSARGERPAARRLPAPTMVQTKVEQTKRGGASNFLLALLVLIAAGAAAAVVYFALPYLT
jgi:serine/threonine protein kinase